MTKDGLVDENLRTGEQKSATAEEKPEQEDSAKETAEKETDEKPIVEEERCMDAEDAPRHHSTAKQSADYYKAHQEEGKPKDAPAESDAEPQTKKGRLSFEDEKGGIVRGMGMGVKKVAKKGVDTATGFAHQKVHQVEKDNSGVEAAHKSEEAAERLHHFVKGRKKPKDKSARAEKRGGEDQKASRLKFSESEGGTAENAAEPSLKKKQPQPPPTAAGGEAKTVGAKFYQKKQYKDAYAAAKRGQKAGTAASKQAAAATNTITEKAKAAVQEIVVQNKTLWVSIGVGILLVMVMLGAFSSCGAAIQGTGSTFVGTTYPSKDADMKGAEEDYLELEKKITSRTATASGKIHVNEAVMKAVLEGTVAKGDVLGVARVAGIMAVKQTAHLIPMCHTLLITKCSVDFEVDEKELTIKALCTAKLEGKTGVEMEALTGVSVALLTIYDMCKAIDKRMEIGEIHLDAKSGGKSGEFVR